jgi:nucleotide-binding universal stress UspA family protein
LITGFRRVLVGVDGSAPAMNAMAVACALASEGGTLALISIAVPPSSFAISPYSLRDEQAWRDDAEAVLSRAAMLVPTNIPVIQIVRPEPAGPRIVEEIRSYLYDVVVVGATGRGCARNLGSVTRYLLTHAPVPVLVVPIGSKSDEISVV